MAQRRHPVNICWESWWMTNISCPYFTLWCGAETINFIFLVCWVPFRFISRGHKRELDGRNQGGELPPWACPSVHHHTSGGVMVHWWTSLPASPPGYQQQPDSAPAQKLSPNPARLLLQALERSAAAGGSLPLQKLEFLIPETPVSS